MDRIEELKDDIQAILIAAGRAVPMGKLEHGLEASSGEIETALRALEQELPAGRGVYVVERMQRSSVRLAVKSKFQEKIGRVLPERALKPLTPASIATLSVIAIRQPISTHEIAQARGILDSAGTVENLARKGLIEYTLIKGVRHWRVTQRFLDRFNLTKRQDLYDEETYLRVFPDMKVVAREEEATESPAEPNEPQAPIEDTEPNEFD